MTKPGETRRPLSQSASSSHLAGLAGEARKLLAPWFSERRFSAGTLLWREGETSGLLVAIRTGRVKIYRLLPTGRAVTVFILGANDVFGFLPFLDGQPYPAYAQALDDVTAEVMSRDDLVRAVRERPEISITLFALLGRRLRDAFDRIERLSTPGVVGRVAGVLQALVEQAGRDASPVIELPIPASELAGAIGITPETLSRAISRLVQEGVLRRLAPRRLQVLDPGALAATARLSSG